MDERLQGEQRATTLLFQSVCPDASLAECFSHAFDMRSLSAGRECPSEGKCVLLKPSVCVIMKKSTQFEPGCQNSGLLKKKIIHDTC